MSASDAPRLVTSRDERGASDAPRLTSRDERGSGADASRLTSRDERGAGADASRRDDRDRSRSRSSHSRRSRSSGRRRSYRRERRDDSSSSSGDDGGRRRRRRRSRSYSSDSSDYSRDHVLPPPLTQEELEILELTRDARTVFVSQLLVRVSEDDLIDFFEQAGRIARCTLIRDRSSGKSKGMGYVEFADLESVPAALLLNGAKFCLTHRACSCSGFPAAVKASEAERNYAAQAEKAGGSTTARDAARRLYICGLSTAVTEMDLKKLAEQIGPVDRTVIITHGGALKVSKGYGFVIFHDAVNATRAATQLHGLPVAGKPITVGRLNELGHVVTVTGETVPLAGGGGALTAQARAAISARLGAATVSKTLQLSSVISQSVAASTSAAAVAKSSATTTTTATTANIDMPSNCVVISNAFDPATETEPTWPADILNDINTELARHGKVVFSKLDPKDSRGLVFAMLADDVQARVAMDGLTGRGFGTRTLGAHAVPILDFLQRFPESAEAAAALVL